MNKLELCETCGGTGTVKEINGDIKACNPNEKGAVFCPKCDGEGVSTLSRDGHRQVVSVIRDVRALHAE